MNNGLYVIFWVINVFFLFIDFNIGILFFKLSSVFLSLKFFLINDKYFRKYIKR